MKYSSCILSRRYLVFIKINTRETCYTCKPTICLGYGWYSYNLNSRIDIKRRFGSAGSGPCQVGKGEVPWIFYNVASQLLNVVPLDSITIIKGPGAYVLAVSLFVAISKEVVA